MSRALTIVCGVFLIAILTPLSQFLTMMSLTADVEAATPVGWAVGAVVSLVLVGAVLRLLFQWRVISRENLVILYCMLTLSVPVMNVGLIRPCFLSMRSVMQEYLVVARSDLRTAYNSLNPDWFPVVPTTEGLAWNKANRLLRLLTDDEAVNKRIQAERAIKTALDLEAKRLEQAAGNQVVTIDAIDDQAKAKLADLLGHLGLDQLAALRANNNLAKAITSLGLSNNLNAALETKQAESRAAAEQLPAQLEGVSEFEVSLLPVNLKKLDITNQRRLRALEQDWASLERRVEQLSERAPALMKLVTSLSDADYRTVLHSLETALAEKYASMSDDDLAKTRHDFVYRLSRVERNEMVRQDGRSDAPNQNIHSLTEGMWWNSDDKRVAEKRSFRDNLAEVLDLLPWHLWIMPLLMWGALFTSVFLFLMCVAEWLRRKWVDRENLAFPLVEVIDNVIRHDAQLETASDVTNPEPRRHLFNLVFLAGFMVGLVILSLEAMGHYQLLFADRPVLFFNVSEQVLTKGWLQEMNNVYFVVSPIVVGLLFLVSLEISFSVWVLFIVYSLAVLMFKQLGLNLEDKGYTGWAGGRYYPFSAEQLVGACLFFAGVTLWKSWFTGRAKPQPNTPAPVENHFIPRNINRAGLVLLPLIIVALLWQLGITNFPLLFCAAALVMALTIAAARARAETGLYTHHVSYEFSKLPIVLGMTGATGASVYTRFITAAFLPMTLLFRSLGQQLENIELARRHRLRYQTVAVAGLVGFATALVVGLLSFLVMSYYFGGEFFGDKMFAVQKVNAAQIASYPFWVAHFFGEVGLDKFTAVHWLRIQFAIAGAAVFGLLYYLRNRFIRFPIHPLGYLLLLLSIYYSWVSPYARSKPGVAAETSWIWGSALVAWLLKKLMVKYGGMNTYKRAKPFFIGLVVGAVFAVFAWSTVDLTCSLLAKKTAEPSAFMKHFIDRPPFSSWYY
jgi:hypothetical protein